MIGAIIGDTIGTLYRVNKGKNIMQLNALNGTVPYSENTIEMIAVADAIMHSPHDSTNEVLKKRMTESIKKHCSVNSNVKYNEKLTNWISNGQKEAYGDDDNETACRAISIGYFYDTLEKTMEVAKLSAEITHSGQGALNGAMAVAGAVYLARTKHTKDEIKSFLIENFDFEMNRTVSFLQLSYSYSNKSDLSIPEAMICALEARNFNAALQNVVSLSSESNTMIVVCGALAKALYGYPLDLGIEIKTMLRGSILSVLDYFFMAANQPDPFFMVNNPINNAIQEYTKNKTNENLNKIFNQIYTSMKHKGHLLIPSEQVSRTVDGKVQMGQRMRTIKDEKGKVWQVGFTNPITASNGPKSTLLSIDIHSYLSSVEKLENCEGIIINPFTKGMGIRLIKPVIHHILDDSNFVKVKVDPNTLN